MTTTTPPLKGVPTMPAVPEVPNDVLTDSQEMQEGLRAIATMTDAVARLIDSITDASKRPELSTPHGRLALGLFVAELRKMADTITADVVRAETALGKGD